MQDSIKTNYIQHRRNSYIQSNKIDKQIDREEISVLYVNTSASQETLWTYPEELSQEKLVNINKVVMKRMEITQMTAKNLALR